MIETQSQYDRNPPGFRIINARFLVLFAVVLISYSPIYKELIHTWLVDSDNSHGLLVPFVAAYIAWTIRGKTDCVSPGSSWLGLVLLVMSLSIYLIGMIGGIVFLPRISFILTLMAIVLYNYGWNVFKIYLFPLFFLIFMIPVPDTLLGMVSFPLQRIVSSLSASIISFLGIPVFQEGNLLHFANYSFEVTEACSGIRSLVVLIALATFLSYITTQSYWARFLILASSIPIAALGNLIRVVITGLVAHAYGNWTAQGFLHEFSGIIIFGFGIVGLVVEIFLLKNMPSFKVTCSQLRETR